MKNLGKKLIACFCSAALAASMTAAVSAEGADTSAYEVESGNVKLIGRTYRYNDSTWLTYSACGVEFKCTGSSVRFNLRQGGDATRTAVYVNGKLVKVGMVDKKSKAPVIDVDLEAGENIVKLVKLSESANSVLAIDSIETDGEISPTENKAHSIEFIGDSITCGYGADGSLREAFATTNENAAKTYAYLTADNFDADYSFVSVSGAGIISGYSGGGQKNEALLIPNEYEKLCFTWSWIDGVCPKDYAWDFLQYQPEVVVINLGTNDNSYTRGDEEKCSEYEEGYEEFLKTVRAFNPDSAIFCTLGIMGQELYPSIENAVEAYKAETGDENIYTFEFSVQNADANGYGSDYHPSEQSHYEAAQELTAEISSVLGWETATETETGMAGYDKANDELFTDDPNAVDSGEESSSSSEVNSDSSSDSEADGSSSADESTGSSSKADQGSSKAASGSSTSNPSTGAAAGFAAAAVLGAAMIAVKKRK